MNQYFAKQIANAQTITEQNLKKLHRTEDIFGSLFVPGDKQLFLGIRTGDDMEIDVIAERNINKLNAGHLFQTSHGNIPIFVEVSK